MVLSHRTNSFICSPTYSQKGAINTNKLILALRVALMVISCTSAHLQVCNKVSKI